MESLIGKSIGQYEIIEEIGRGGMGTVYKAYQRSLNRYVAIKILPLSKAQDPEFVERFYREARTAAALKHPNILPVYDAGSTEDFYYIVMGYAEGGTLEDLIRMGPLDIEIAIKIVVQLAEALEYAHSKGVIHRDIKPSNILLDEEGRPLLSDFGIAKALEGTKLTQTGIIIGTPEYMSPEQGQGKKIDHRSDIYSLGVVLYEMLTGQLPFKADTPMGIIYKHISEPPPPIRKLRPDVPKWLEEIIMKALAKNPEDRFQKARDLAQALKLGGNIKATIPAKIPKRRGGQTLFWVAMAGTMASLILSLGGLILYFFQPNYASHSLNRLMARVSVTPSITSVQIFTLPTTKILPTFTPVIMVTPTTQPLYTFTPSPTPKILTPTPSPTPTSKPLPTYTPTIAKALGIFIDFEIMGLWKRGDQPYGSLIQSSAQVHEGKYSAQLNYNFPTPDNDFVVFINPIALAGKPNVFKAWIYGDGAGHFFNIWIKDAQGQVWQVPLGQIWHKGWAEMKGYIDTNQKWPWGHISGIDNGKVDYPISFYALVLDDAPDSFIGQGTIYIDDLEAAEEIALIPVETPVAIVTEVPATVTPSMVGGPLSGHIYFTVWHNGHYDLYVANPDGTGMQLLAEGMRQPNVLADGTLILNGEGLGKESLWVRKPTGEFIEVGRHPEDSHPYWSIDGLGAVIDSTLQGDGHSRIYIVRNLTARQEPVPLTFAKMEIFGRNPVWLSDWRIVFNGCDYWRGGSNCGIFVATEWGTNEPIRLTGYSDDLPCDALGNKVLFISPRNNNWDVYVVDAVGFETGLNRLTTDPAHDGPAAWSPDGKAIAFISNRGGMWAMWVMNPDGSNQRKLFDLPGPLGPDWFMERIDWGP